MLIWLFCKNNYDRAGLKEDQWVNRWRDSTEVERSLHNLVLDSLPGPEFEPRSRQKELKRQRLGGTRQTERHRKLDSRQIQ